MKPLAACLAALGLAACASTPLPSAGPTREVAATAPPAPDRLTGTTQPEADAGGSVAVVDVKVGCDVAADGTKSNCAVVSNTGGPQYAASALHFVQTHVYKPASHDGKPIPTYHVWNLHFQPNTPGQPAPAPAPRYIMTGLVYPMAAYTKGEEGDVSVNCDVGVDGAAHNCKVLRVDGDPVFGPAALAFVERARYAPATHNGVPIAQNHTWVLNFRLPR